MDLLTRYMSKIKKLRKHSKRLVRDKGVNGLLQRMLSCKDTRNVLRLILFAKERSLWRGVVATPPASLLEVVVSEFLRETPIACEIPFFATFSLCAQYLCERGARILMGDGQVIFPDLYTVMLAGSGEMKSFAVGKVLRAFDMGGWKPNAINDAGSTAGLLQELKENEGKPVFWWCEEFGEFWSQTKTETHQGTPRVVLMCYDHATLSKRLKASTLVIKDSCLSILGTTVCANFHSKLSRDDWSSGLCQRIAFVYCPKDNERDAFSRRYAILDGINLQRIADEFRKTCKTTVHKDYVFSPDARRKLCDAWEIMGREGITADFVRRIEFRAFKYSMVYHFLLGKENNVIDEQDVNWAVRLAMLHLSDLRHILNNVEHAELNELLRRAENLRLKFGDKLQPRHLLMYLHRQLHGMQSAEALFSLLEDKENDNKAIDVKNYE